MSYKIITWTEDISVGHAGLDREHRGLIELLDEILLAEESGTATSVRLDLLRLLGQSLDEHFAKEEDLMRVHRYPERESHAAAHKAFASHVRRIADGLVERKGESMLKDEETSFLRHGFIDHIVEHDKRYMPWIAKGA